MGLRILIVQHGDKERLPGDPGLTALGRSQAQAAADCLAGIRSLVAVVSSPLLRAAQTAAVVSNRVGAPYSTDLRPCGAKTAGGSSSRSPSPTTFG